MLPHGHSLGGPRAIEALENKIDTRMVDVDTKVLESEKGEYEVSIFCQTQNIEDNARTYITLQQGR